MSWYNLGQASNVQHHAKNEMRSVTGVIREKRWVIILLIVFVMLAATYSVVTPIFEASDEVWHYPVVQYIASGHGLPVQTPTERPGLWKQQASQPPLYYALAALLTAWINTRDMTTVLRWNPHAAVGQVTPDGNINMVAHDPAQVFPWRGTVLAVHLARLLSVALGMATVYLTYRLGREAFPDRVEIALGAAALTAFMPMFAFISGSINNDNLVIPLCALALLIMIRQNKVALDDGPRLMKGYWVLGIVIGLAVLSKVSGVALLALAALTGFVVAWRRGLASRRNDWRHLFAAGLAIGLPVLALTGWWFWRNLQLYGDLFGFKLFVPYFTRLVPADLAQIWSERTSFLYGYWGNFGGLNLPIPAWAFDALNALLLLAAAGWGIRLVAVLRDRRLQTAGGGRQLAVGGQFARSLIALWAVIVLVAWLNWTTTTWSSQGRLVFYALPTYSILIVAGLAGLLPRKAAPFALTALSVTLAVFCAALPFMIIAPAYARPLQLANLSISNLQHSTEVTFGDSLVFLGYDAPVTSARSGDSIRITLYWRALKATERDYSVFLHLLDENDLEVQDKGPAYPGRGNLPTTTLVPGQTWAETWVVPVRGTAYAPARLTWELGLFDSATGARLTARNSAGQSIGDNFRFGQIELARPSGSVFNPVAYNFGDQVELIGFDLDRRIAVPGETVNLTLYWHTLKPPVRDYTVFAHVLQPPQTKWAGFDRQPAPPTSKWQAGQIVSDTYPLKLDAATPSGVYEIEVGVYYLTGPSSFERLKILTSDGRQQQDFVLLSKVRVAR
jgi:4-amino-4-deoxy-L-arabinose transferase-like glycosyltransferase